MSHRSPSALSFVLYDGVCIFHSARNSSFVHVVWSLLLPQIFFKTVFLSNRRTVSSFLGHLGPRFRVSQWLGLKQKRVVASVPVEYLLCL